MFNEIIQATNHSRLEISGLSASHDNLTRAIVTLIGVICDQNELLKMQNGRLEKEQAQHESNHR